MVHSYPKNLATMIQSSWDSRHAAQISSGVNRHVKADQLPAAEAIESIISTCYQTSIMLEEERPLRFRLILRDPDELPADDGPPDGLHRLIFSEARPFNEYELRKLAPAVDYYRSLIGIKVSDTGELSIWGVIHSGQRWTQAIRGGSFEYSPLPPSLVIYVVRPGHIVACRGSEMIAMLNGGKLFTPSKSVLDSHWLSEGRFETHAEIWDSHDAARMQAKTPWANLNRNLPFKIAQQVMKRIISIVRNSHHGGTIISFPSEILSNIISENNYVNIKYVFREEEPRYRFRTLVTKLLNTLAESYGANNEEQQVVGWPEYVVSKNDILNQIDEAIFEYAHFIAGLTAVDGAVIMSQRQELIGFGGVILGSLDRVSSIARALDPEGNHTVTESVDGVGMRHRAVYQLCNERHDALAMVISQDENVEIVKWKNGSVTCWNVFPYPHFTDNLWSNNS